MTTTTTAAATMKELRGGVTTNDQSSCRHSSLEAEAKHMSTETKSAHLNRAFVAVGSNLGHRYTNIATALDQLNSHQQQQQQSTKKSVKVVDNDVDNGNGDGYVRLLRTSYLYETPPMYVTDQPAFLNGVVEVETNLSPHALLKRLKQVEKDSGRDPSGIRNGPRPVDLDIVLFRSITDESSSSSGDEETLSSSSSQYHATSGLSILNTPELEIPHPRMTEREFVLLPLSEIAQNVVHPVLNRTIGALLAELLQNRATEDGNKEEEAAAAAVRTIPLPRGRMLLFNETLIMGILNVTPDSFSDGGVLKGSVELALQKALQMVSDGAHIIDIGGESTRPGATEVAINEELQRTIPVIRKIREVSDVPISIDTRHAAVAKEAIEAGADIANDVSGGTFDPEMLKTVAQLKVPMILMHMRGTPETMQSMTSYGDVVTDVANKLLELSARAQDAGIPRWLQILDPGIGFAKDMEGNLKLLRGYGQLQSLLGGFPLLLGTSRKGFIGKITGASRAEDRDFGTIASCIAALSGARGERVGGFNILRVHNVNAMKQAALVMDAIHKTNK